MNEDSLRALSETLGDDLLRLPAQFGDRHFADWSGVESAMPRALLLPRTTADVSAMLAACTRLGQPVVTQGGLTGLAGGACVRGGEVVLSLERMNRIEAVDRVAGTMTVQAGVALQTVQEAALDAGWQFPLDLGARGSCTIGGNLATNAGGNRVLKYGMMRDQVLGLEAVLADGSIVGPLHDMVKVNSGYDLKHLIIGSEGTLAVITRAVLRLRPRPLAVATAFCGLPDDACVTGLLNRAQSALPGGVSAFEVMWPSYHDFVTSRLPALRAPLADRHAFYVLLESFGGDPAAHADAFERLLASLIDDGVVTDAALANSEADARAFWAIRDAPGEYPRLIPGYVGYDISFSIARIADAAAALEAALHARWPEATALFYGHLGDGNLHVVVHRPGAPDDGGADEVDALVYGITRDFDGAISAEHGVGLKRRAYLPYTRSAADLAAMRAVKAALDPHQLLNPGKVFLDA